MSEIVSLILQRMKTQVEQELVLAQPPDDVLIPSMVKVGRFQDDPVTNRIYVALNTGDSADPEFMDGIVTLREMERIGVRFPAREIGGGERWWRRGRAQIGCFFITTPYTEEVALDYSHIVMGRLRHAVDNTHVSDLVDEFGERAKAIFVYARNFFESGGPPNQYIWRGSIHWQVLTEYHR